MRDEAWPVGAHPYHDARFIATADAEFEDVHESGEDKHYLRTGLIVAKMMDTERQADYARLLAAAPAMDGLLRDGAMQFGRLTGENLETYARTFAALVSEMLAKAKGTP